MATEIRLEAPDHADAQDWFRSVVPAIADVTEALATENEIPLMDITAVLTQSFDSAVDEVLRSLGIDDSGSFTSERIGGIVAAKTMLTKHGPALVLFNADMWAGVENGHGKAQSLATVAHEYAHALLEASWRASGVLETERIPSVTGTEYARSIARIVTTEIRADLIAGSFLSVMASTEIDGQKRPASLYDLRGEGHDGQLLEILPDIHPGWPDTVDDYRHGQIDLWKLASTVISSTEGVLTLVAHIDSVRQLEGKPSIVEDVDHPAMDVYLRNPWLKLRGTLKDRPLITTPVEEKETVARIMELGSEAVLDVWRKLGLTVEERGGDEWALWVEEPER